VKEGSPRGAWACVAVLLEGDGNQNNYEASMIGNAGMLDFLCQERRVGMQVFDWDLVTKVTRPRPNAAFGEHPRIFAARGTTAIRTRCRCRSSRRKKSGRSRHVDAKSRPDQLDRDQTRVEAYFPRSASLPAGRFWWKVVQTPKRWRACRWKSSPWVRASPPSCAV
jgi:hypothetical protein